jgi:hypothetical protein
MLQNTAINEFSVNVSGWLGTSRQLYSTTTFTGKTFILFRFRVLHSIIGIYEIPST